MIFCKIGRDSKNDLNNDRNVKNGEEK